MSVAPASDSRQPLGTRRLLPLGIAGDVSWARHRERYGPLRLDGRGLVAEVERSGLTGRGGAAFPTAVKLAAVAKGRKPVVVANGTEGEPASGKDAVLMAFNPHLVIDGVLTALAAVGGSEAYLAVSERSHRARAALEGALAERRREAEQIRVVETPARFVAGEESALVNLVSGGDAKPTFRPPRPFERGVGGRPTLVQNVETLANLALIARFGADWFRTAGTHSEPGTVLVTASGCLARPGVIEVEPGTPLRALAERCGGLTAEPQAVLVGGYFGTWLGADALDLPLLGSSAPLGARAIVVLPREACGLGETARVARYLAGESAGQCGPCVFGLPAVADALESIAAARRGAAGALDRQPRLAAQIARRGACAHPDGALRFVESALRVFDREIQLHLSGRCSATHREPVLPT
jgi:NADH:ubiquinone oxidoreductase subunit F (NADH-binding)